MTDTASAQDRMDTASLDVAAERVERLREDFPEVFQDGKIDFDALKRSLGEWVDPGKERFGLTWPGKAACMRTIQQPSTGTLRPDRAESVDFDTTQNVIIEGENLEVLKLLQKSYYGKVKMIYIDPPYNTGNDFIYSDDFREPLARYLRLSGQTDEGGSPLSTNTESEGRYHSNWLNMMYPRLFLARNLLSEDGAIFVSIDDNEHMNARLILDEIFGPENFVTNIVWNHTRQSKNDERYFSRHHNSVLVYRRSGSLPPLSFTRSEQDNTAYSNPDNDPKGSWRSGDVRSPNYRATLRYPITTPSGGTILPPTNGWRWKEETLFEKIGTGEIVFSSDETRIIRKIYLAEQTGRTPENLWSGDFAGTSRDANSELKDLFDEAPFETPKPALLVQRMLELVSPDGLGIVLDFFAGSGTTAHAVMKQNAADGGNRRYILVQLPEPTEGDYPTVSAITRERVRRAGKAIAAERASKLDLDGTGPLDVGFRAYHLAESNVLVPRTGQGSVETPAERASQPALFADTSRTPSPVQIELFADNIRPGRSDEELLTQILLSTGYELTVPVERLSLGGVEVFSVQEGDLLVCLSRQLTMEVIEAMAEREPAQIICLDVGFGGNDALKVNAVQAIKARGKSQFRVL